MRLVVLFASMAILAGSASADAKPRPATKTEIEAIRESLQTQLKDADSAKFRDAVANNSVKEVRDICGDINAKNSYGAYGGFVRFYSIVAMQTDGKTVAIMTVIDSEDSTLASDMCAKKGM